MISVKEAHEQAETLLAAAEVSPVRHYRYELRRRGKEWKRAADDLMSLADGEGVIELAGSLGSGMEILHEHDLGNWASLIRTLQNGGQFSLHYEDPMGRSPAGIYRNLIGPTSPVVVRS